MKRIERELKIVRANGHQNPESGAISSNKGVENELRLLSGSVQNQTLDMSLCYVVERKKNLELMGLPKNVPDSYVYKKVNDGKIVNSRVSLHALPELGHHLLQLGAGVRLEA